MEKLVGYVAIAIVMAGCNKKDETKTDTKSSQPGQAKAIDTTPRPTTSAMCGDAAGPEWLKSIPAKAPTAKVGDKVWAVQVEPPAEGDKAWLRTFKVESIQGTTVTVARDGDDTKHKVCGSLVFAFTGSTGLKPGDLAMVETGVGIGVMEAVKVDKLDGESVTVKHTMTDSIAERTVETSQAIPTGVTPLGYVAYEYDGNVGLRTGYVLAINGDKAHVLTPGFDQVDIKSVAELKAARPCAKDFAVGDAVTALDSQRDDKKGKITKVVEPLVYEVDFAKDKAKKYPCTLLTETAALGM